MKNKQNVKYTVVFKFVSWSASPSELQAIIAKPIQQRRNTSRRWCFWVSNMALLPHSLRVSLRVSLFHSSFPIFSYRLISPCISLYLSVLFDSLSILTVSFPSSLSLSISFYSFLLFFLFFVFQEPPNAKSLRTWPVSSCWCLADTTATQAVQHPASRIIPV